MFEYLKISDEQQLRLERLEIQRHNDRRRRLASGTLLFDRSGKLMGDSRTMLYEAPELERR